MVNQWAEWFVANPNAVDIVELDAVDAKEKRLRRERARLEREIERRKKLLAKREVMLKLRQKAIEIYGNAAAK